MGLKLIYWTPMKKNMEKQLLLQVAKAGLGKYRMDGCGRIGVQRVKPGFCKT